MTYSRVAARQLAKSIFNKHHKNPTPCNMVSRTIFRATFEFLIWVQKLATVFEVTANIPLHEIMRYIDV